jgi:hypothetical protein
LLAVENLLAAQASLSQLRSSATPVAEDLIEQNGHVNGHGRGESVDSISVGRAKRKREETNSPPPESSASGEMFVNVRGGHFEEDTPAPDTVLDGMGALNLGDDEDYGYFGASIAAILGEIPRCNTKQQQDPHQILPLSVT